MPLAIELAAGRLSGFSLRDLHDRLDRSLDLLGGGRPSADARHRTLRATVEWSYALLHPEEQRLFRHLSVFVDGVDLTTAEEIAAELRLADDPGAALAHLVDASMVEAVFEGSGFDSRGTRYRMLETLRAFGLDRLAASGEDEAAAERLVRWAVALTDRLDATQATDREPEADAALRRELANLRAAWRLTRERGDLDAAAALVVGLYDVSSWRDLTEPGAWAEELAADRALAGQRRAAGVLGSAAYNAYIHGDYVEADRLARAGLRLRPAGEDAWICLIGFAVAALAAGAFDDVVEGALSAAAAWHRPAAPLGIATLGALYRGDLALARDLQERTAAAGMSPTARGFAAYVAGEIANLTGEPDRAEAHYATALDLFRSSGATFGTAIALVGLLSARTRAGRVYDALRGFRDVVDYFERAGNWTHQWTTLRNLAELLRMLGDAEPAALIDAAADAAPDAPPADGRPSARPRPGAPGRAEALASARSAIARHLDAAPAATRAPRAPRRPHP
jgi:tetratricopeptide (TPR) repeat protein